MIGRSVISGKPARTFSPIDSNLSTWSQSYQSRLITPVSITILGDSVTAGTGVTTPQRFSNLLESSLTGVTVHNQGVSAWPSANFTNPANYTLGEPRLVIVELGLNDMATTVSGATFKANIEDLISDIRTALTVDPSFLLLTSYEIGDTYTNPWSVYADKLDEVADADDNVLVLDLRPSFGTPTTTYLQSDLVHPNVAGHSLIADLIENLIT